MRNTATPPPPCEGRRSCCSLSFAGWLSRVLPQLRGCREGSRVGEAIRYAVSRYSLFVVSTRAEGGTRERERQSKRWRCILVTHHASSSFMDTCREVGATSNDVNPLEKKNSESWRRKNYWSCSCGGSFFALPGSFVGLAAAVVPLHYHRAKYSNAFLVSSHSIKSAKKKTQKECNRV